MKLKTLVESLDPITINRYARDAYQTINDVLGSAKSTADARTGTFGTISKNPAAIAVLDDILGKINLKDYSSALREAKDNAVDKHRRYLFSIATVIPSFAAYLSKRLESVTGIDRAFVTRTRDVFNKTYENARMGTKNPMIDAVIKFYQATTSAVEENTATRRNTSVADDMTASGKFIDTLGNIKNRINTGAEFVKEVLRVTGCRASEDAIDIAAWLLLAQYFAGDDDMTNKGIPEFTDFLSKTVEKSDPAKLKKVANIDDTDAAANGNGGIAGDYVLKSLDSSGDSANQHSMITGLTKFTGVGFVKLFAANFAEGLKKQPTATAGSKDKRVTQRDVMAAMKLIIRHVSPDTNINTLTPDSIDSMTANLIANDTNFALDIHEAMARYVIAAYGDPDGSLLEDLSKIYPDEKYCRDIRTIVLKIYLKVGNQKVGSYSYLPEVSYSFGELSSNDRAKTSGLTSTGSILMSLFNNDGETVHVMNMNNKTKMNIDNGDSEIAVKEIDTIPINEIQERGKDYKSPSLVMLPVDNYVWGFIYGIKPFSRLNGEDFEDATSVDSLTTELKTRIGNEDPLKWKKAELVSTNRIASRLYSADTRRKMTRVGFATNDFNDEDYKKFADNLFKVSEENASIGEVLTKTATIAKAFTGVVNNYLRLCTAIKDDALTARKRTELYSMAPSAESMVVQGDSAIDYSVLRFLAKESQSVGAESSINDVSENCVKPLVLAIKNAQHLQNNNGNLSVEMTGKTVNRCVNYFSMFANWITRNQVGNIQLTPEDKNIVAGTGDTASLAKAVTNPQTVARWVSWVKQLSESAISGNTGDPIVDQEIANRQYLIDGWKAVAQKYIKDAGYTKSDLSAVQKLCKSFAVEERPFNKFNELYTATQLLISLRDVGGLGTAEEQSFDNAEEFEYENPDLGNLEPARAVSAADPENKNARELNDLVSELDGASVNAVYGDGDESTPVTAEDAFSDMASRVNEIKNPFDRALSCVNEIQKLSDEGARLNDFKNDMQDDELTETQQSAVWDVERRIDAVNQMKSGLQLSLVKDFESNKGVASMVYAIQNGAVSAEEVAQARRIIGTAEAISNDLYNAETREETAYTSSDSATISHLVTVLGDEAFSTSGIDVKDAYDGITTLRSYVQNASGNPASMKAIDYVLKALSQAASDNAKSSDVFGTFIRLINKVGRIISTDSQSVSNALNDVHGLRYDKTEDYDAVKDPTKLDNPIDAFARARLRPLSMKNTGVVSDAESEERLAFNTNMFAAMKENPELARYAYNVGRAMSTFERSLVNDDERFSDKEREERQFNSIKDSLDENNLLYGEIAQTVPQRLVYNAIFDDERAGKLNYPKTARVVDGLVNGYNLNVLSKEFKKPGERETGADWARKRDSMTTGYSFRDDKFARQGEALDEDENKEEIVASWFNPDHPTPSSDIKELVKSARQYICSKIADRIGTIDDLTGEVNLANGKTSEALKAAVKSIHALADDVETPIADVIVATTSLGQKNARAALVERAKESLISGDENYTVDDMGDIASELNVFPERLSGEVSTVDEDWIDSMAALVAAIPEDLSVKDVRTATEMYCGSLADQRLMMGRPGFKMMYAILHKLQSMKTSDGSPMGYFGDNSGDEKKNLQAVINSICVYRSKAGSWKEAAAAMKEYLTKVLATGATDRRVGARDLPSQPARKKLAHLRMDPNYSVANSDKSHLIAQNVMKALTSSRYFVPGNSSRSVMIAGTGIVLDVKTLSYWLKVVANQMLKTVNFEDIDDEKFTSVAEHAMDSLVMTYITGVKPKYLNYVTKSAESSKVSDDTALSEGALALTNAELAGDGFVKVAGIGLLTTDAYVAAFKTAYDTAAAEHDGKPSDQDIANAFVVQLGVLTGKTFNTKTKSYDAETPKYDLGKLGPVTRPANTAAPTVIKDKTDEPVPEPKADEQTLKPEEEKELEPTAQESEK